MEKNKYVESVIYNNKYAEIVMDNKYEEIIVIHNNLY